MSTLPASPTNHPAPGPTFIPFVAALIALGPFAIDTYLPAMPSMAAALDTAIVNVNYTLSTYLVGFGLGQLVGGPLSDQIGRRPIGLLGLALFTVCALLIANATSINQVLALRAVQAFGGGFATVICMAMVRDAFTPMDAAKRFPRIMLVMLVAPLIAPAIGAAMLPLGWQSIFIFLAIYALVMMALLTTMGETNTTRSGQLAFGRIFPQYLEVISRRVEGRLIPLRYILAQGLLASILMNFITNASFVYLEYYDVGANLFVFYFAATVIGMMIGNLVASRLVLRHAPYTLFVAARAAQVAFLLALTTLVTLSEPPVLVFAPMIGLVVGCAGVITPSVQGLYLAPFKNLAGSAVSLMNTSTFLMGSLAGVLSGLFYDGTLRPMVYTMLAATLAGNLIALTIVRTDPADHD